MFICDRILEYFGYIAIESKFIIGLRRGAKNRCRFRCCGYSSVCMHEKVMMGDLK